MRCGLAPPQREILDPPLKSIHSLIAGLKKKKKTRKKHHFEEKNTILENKIGPVIFILESSLIMFMFIRQYVLYLHV